MAYVDYLDSTYDDGEFVADVVLADLTEDELNKLHTAYENGSEISLLADNTVSSIEGVLPGAFQVNGKTVYIRKVVYAKPKTIIVWSDGTNTQSTAAESEVYSPDAGLSVCVMKKLFGSKQTKDLLKYFAKRDGKNEVSVKDVRKLVKASKDVR